MNTTYRGLGIGIVFAFVLGLGTFVRAQDEAPLVTVEIRGLQALVDDINRVSMGLQYGPMGALLSRQVQGALGGGDDFGGIDTNGTVRAFIYQRSPEAPHIPGESVPFVLVVPTRDGGKAFMRAITNTMERGDAADGITQFRMRDSGMASGRDLSVGSVANQLVLGQNRDRVETVVAGLQAGTYGESQRIGVPGTLAINVNVPAISGLARKMFANLSASTAEQLESAGSDMNVGGILSAEGEIIGDVLDQIDALQLGLQAEPGNLVFASRLVMKPNTMLAGVTAASRPPRSDFLRVLPTDSSMFSQVGHIGNVDGIMDLYLNMVEKMSGSMGAAGEALMPSLRDTLTEMKGIGTGDYAMSFGVDQNPVRLRWVGYFGLKDPARAKALTDKYVTLFGATNLFPGINTSIVPNPGRSHNGVEIASYTYSTGFDADMMMVAPVPPFMTQLTNMVYEVAFVGDVGVVTMGGAELMNGSLDRLASPGTSITERPLIRSMFGNDPNLAKATDVATFSLVDYMKFIVSMMPGVDASMLEMIPASGSGIGAYSVAEGNTEVSVMKLGIAEIVTLKSMAPMMMMGAMSRSAGQGGMGGSGGDYEPEMDDEEDVPYTDDMDSDE